MRLSSLVAVAAAITMVAVPAYANPAAGLSLAPSDAQSGGGSDAGGDAAAGAHAGHHTALVLIGGLAAAGAVAGAAVALSSHHDNKPASY